MRVGFLGDIKSSISHLFPDMIIEEELIVSLSIMHSMILTNASIQPKFIEFLQITFIVALMAKFRLMPALSFESLSLLGIPTTFISATVARVFSIS